MLLCAGRRRPVVRAAGARERGPRPTSDVRRRRGLVVRRVWLRRLRRRVLVTLRILARHSLRGVESKSTQAAQRAASPNGAPPRLRANGGGPPRNGGHQLRAAEATLRCTPPAYGARPSSRPASGRRNSPTPKARPGRWRVRTQPAAIPAAEQLFVGCGWPRGPPLRQIASTIEAHAQTNSFMQT